MLSNKVRNIDNNSYTNNYNNNNNNRGVLINIIATDGNYSYNKVINNTKGINKDNNKHIK